MPPPACGPTPPSATRPTRWRRGPTSSSGSSTTTSCSRGAPARWATRWSSPSASPPSRRSPRPSRPSPPSPPHPTIRCGSCARPRSAPSTARCRCTGWRWSTSAPTDRSWARFRVVGVFSRKAAAEPAVVTPMLRFKLRRILELEDVVEGSYDESTLVSLFQVLPKEELFEADVETLRRVILGLAAAEQTQRRPGPAAGGAGRPHRVRPPGRPPGPVLHRPPPPHRALPRGPARRHPGRRQRVAGRGRRRHRPAGGAGRRAPPGAAPARPRTGGAPAVPHLGRGADRGPGRAGGRRPGRPPGPRVGRVVPVRLPGRGRPHGRGRRRPPTRRPRHRRP